EGEEARQGEGAEGGALADRAAGLHAHAAVQVRACQSRDGEARALHEREGAGGGGDGEARRQGVNVAIYVRVSTSEQTADNQLPDVERLCAARGWTITHRYNETVSGATRQPPELARMLANAHASRFGAVVVWALDRLGRGGIAEVSGIVAKLDAARVSLVTVREPWADTSGPMRDLLLAL